MKDLLTFPQLPSCGVCLITFPSGCKNKQSPDTASFHSLHLSANKGDGLHEMKPRCPLHFPPNCTSCPFTTLSKPTSITFQATKLSQNSQTSGCILGMPRKLLLLTQELGAGEQRCEIPSVFITAQIMTDTYLPFLKGQERKTGGNKKYLAEISNPENSSRDCKTLPILNRHFSRVTPTYPSTGWRHELVFHSLGVPKLCTPVSGQLQTNSCLPSSEAFILFSQVHLNQQYMKPHGLFSSDNKNTVLGYSLRNTSHK